MWTSAGSSVARNGTMKDALQQLRVADVEGEGKGNRAGAKVAVGCC